MQGKFKASKLIRSLGMWLLVVVPAATWWGCGEFPPQTDAAYVGSSACLACHPVLMDWHRVHGHSQALKLVEGQAPEYPPEAPNAGVPSPPAGFEWFDTDYLMGGYSKAANFIDDDGYFMTDGTAGTETQYNLRVTAAQVEPGFVPFLPGVPVSPPFAYTCFRCHTTAAESVTTNGGRRQGNNPGVGGTWAEAGVQCEACHGPGGRHVPHPRVGNIIGNPSPALCDSCHAGDSGVDVIDARDGFIGHSQQSSELAGSPHQGFSCAFCHDPHASTLHDRPLGLRNDCVDCHTDQNMARHAGKVFVQGDHVEELTCVSCHMPLASKTVVSAPDSAVGASAARIGDTRTHIFNIDTRNVDYEAMLTDDGTEVRKDMNGQAAVTLDFVCLRCHNGVGSAFLLPISGASAIADGMHD